MNIDQKFYFKDGEELTDSSLALKDPELLADYDLDQALRYYWLLSLHPNLGRNSSRTSDILLLNAVIDSRKSKRQFWWTTLLFAISIVVSAFSLWVAVIALKN